jgi:hypothetical protein
MLEIAFTTKGEDPAAFVLRFERTTERVVNFRPAFMEIARAHGLYMDEVFTTEGRTGLGQWRELTPSYSRWKERAYPGMPIGTRTGDLRRDAGRAVMAGSNRILMGPQAVAYAPFFNAERPFLPINERQERMYREIFRRHVLDAIHGARGA